MKNIKIGFIYSKQDTFQCEYVPVAFGYIIAYLRKHFSHDFEYVVTDNPEELINADVDIVGFSSVTRALNKAISDAGKIKKSLDIPLILGGSHVTGLPESLPKVFDVGVVGEGEQTFLELMVLFAEKGRVDCSGLANINGLVYRDEGTSLKITEKRQFVAEIDLLPHPEREYYKKFNADPYLTSSRGCPYRCVFCLTAKTWGYKYRCFSAKYVVNEIKSIINEFPAAVKKEVFFADDLFVSNKKRLREFISCLKSEGLLGKYRIAGNVRANLVDREFCDLLIEAGFYRVNFGLESASEKVLSYLKCDSLTVEQIQNALNLLYEYGIVVKNSFIIGSPGETEDDLAMTYEFINKNMRQGKMLEALANTMIPFPGTAIWEYAAKKGLVSVDMDWDKISKYTWFRGDLLQGNCDSLDDWLNKRKSNGTIYLGDIPEDKFFRIVEKYENEIEEIKRSNPPVPNVGEIYGFKLEARP